jgi:acyl carrier protein
MTRPTAQDVKALILSCLESTMMSLALVPDQLSDDFDLRAEGVVDSLGFVQLITALEERLGFDVDLGELDTERLTVIGPLSQHIAESVAIPRPGCD